ncbi:putative toxin-antitoxin system toxin component, PIN family [candidate division KSB1 bacterium]|nr:putative toxin-antitoxin system toxin component, PIN family [candidate division KSB1 bacterium]
MKFNIVIDTNVIVSALRSRKGASFELVSLLESDAFGISISVPLILEYESVLFRELKHLTLHQKDIEYFLDYLCTIGNKFDIHYLWRPFLKDPNDDFILELAVTSGSDFIVTFNKKDFEGVDKFGIDALTPQEFLRLLER